MTATEAKALIGQKAENGVEFTADMLRDVLKYTDQVQQLVESTGGTLHVEQRLPIGQWTDEADAHGTSDAVIVAGDELIVADLKFGMGVEVSAVENKQLMVYGLAALDVFGKVEGGYSFKTVRLVISQPRTGNFSEWTVSVEDLLAFGKEVKMAAATTRMLDAPLHASEKACKFCKAKATCPALTKAVESATGALFEDCAPPGRVFGADLSVKMSMVKLVEDWCKAIRAETERSLLAGEAVPGYKLVQGKMGNRKWSDAEEAEATLKGIRLKVEEMYDLSLISPTTAEKLMGAGTIGPRQWKKVIPLITRSEGQPSVAPESDKRPALVVGGNTDDFDVVQTAEDFV
jgi:hypothetical protein